MGINFIAGRKLGAIERFFWLNDKNRSNHFSIAGEIKGHLSSNMLRACLRDLAPNLGHAAGRIIEDAYGDARFSRSFEQVDLRVVDRTTSDIAGVLAEELSKPFITHRGPLLRCVILEDQSRTTLILTAHHAVADGLSLTLLLRDILMSASGQKVGRSSVGPCLEDRVVPALPVGEQPQNNDVPPQRPAAAYRDDSAFPHVEILGLSELETLALLTAARANGTTIQTALSAAVCKVSSHRLTPADGGSLRILTPLDTRKRLLNGSEDLGVFVAGSVVSDPGESFDPWDRARGFDAALTPLKDASGTIAAVEALGGAMDGIKTVEEASAFFAMALGSELMITNLGNLDIPTQYGNLVLERVWGPAVTVGFAQEQSIGVTALGGSISLVHTSFAPVEGLLAEVRQELGLMCQQTGP